MKEKMKNLGKGILIGLGIVVLLIIIIVITVIILEDYLGEQNQAVTRYVCEDGSIASEPAACSFVEQNPGVIPQCSSSEEYDSTTNKCLKSATIKVGRV